MASSLKWMCDLIRAGEQQGERGEGVREGKREATVGGREQGVMDREKGREARVRGEEGRQGWEQPTSSLASPSPTPDHCATPSPFSLITVVTSYHAIIVITLSPHSPLPPAASSRTTLLSASHLSVFASIPRIYNSYLILFILSSNCCGGNVSHFRLHQRPLVTDTETRVMCHYRC